MKKKIDKRIWKVISQCAESGHRSVFVIVGERGRDQVVNIFHMLRKTSTKSENRILWCYNRNLNISSNAKRRNRDIQELLKRGLFDPERDEQFNLFVSCNDIRYCHYSDTQTILGSSFRMCIFQDFETITPNVLARSIETVEGGGCVFFFVSKIDCLQSLHKVLFALNEKFKSDASVEHSSLFNKRFFASLSKCKTSFVLDDELNIIYSSANDEDDSLVETRRFDEYQSFMHRNLQDSLRGIYPLHELSMLCKTIDQTKALLVIMDALSEKFTSSVVSMTSQGRGRGKSALLGLICAGAVYFGYSNIMLIAPSLLSIPTVFAFLQKGLNAIGLHESIHYSLQRGKIGTQIEGISIHRNTKQFIRFIEVNDIVALHKADLLIVDEAAGLPPKCLRNFLNSTITTVMSTTSDGYEGFGKSWSIKLMKELRLSSCVISEGENRSRRLCECELSLPIRYGNNDPVEKWLEDLLCLSKSPQQLAKSGQNAVDPNSCSLFYVNRDALFEMNEASEAFLGVIMSIFSSAHYRHSPDDLQLLADARTHQLFCLLPPFEKDSHELPDVLCVIHVSIEGGVSIEKSDYALKHGDQPRGDLIPWTLSHQFQNAAFPTLKGVRIVRIATHPKLTRMGYGSRAVQLLHEHYFNNGTEEKFLSKDYVQKNRNVSLLSPASDMHPGKIDYLGVSYGLNSSLLNFWTRASYFPVYMSQVAADATGEQSCIMLRSDASQRIAKDLTFHKLHHDFRMRFLRLLPGPFRMLHPSQALQILQCGNGAPLKSSSPLHDNFSMIDIKRLQCFCVNVSNYRLILDLMQTISMWYFSHEQVVTFTSGQCAMLIGVGLQQRSIEEISAVLTLPFSQLLTLMHKLVRRLLQDFLNLHEAKLHSEDH